jgi:hypothetical protein
MSKARWHIRDIIDFEYFLKSDEQEEETTTSASYAKRDRTIYLEHIQPMESRGQALTISHTLRIWLEQRRDNEKSRAGVKGILPGETFDEIYRLMLYLLMIIGFITGAGLAFSFLNYRGTEPLNVTAYLGGFVLTQIFLLFVLFFMVLIRSWKKHPLRSSVIFILITGLISRLMTRVKRSSLKALSGSRRDMLEGTIGLIQGKRQVYGSLFYWPVFFSSQLFMVAFNIGVLSATLLKVLGSDIAFGWQSTIQLGSHFVFNLVKTIALPWSWFVSAGTAYPTLAQIEGTHMVLKDGIYHLETVDLVSWWPFLCLSLVFYGLLPRVIVLILGLIMEKRALSRIGFLHGAPARLFNRMRTPIVTTKGDLVEMDGQSTRDIHPLMDSKYQPGTRSSTDLIALIPDEIFDECPFDELKDLVFKRRGAQILSRMKFNEEDKINSEKIKREENPDILLLLESWQPPIRESLFLLKDLRKSIGKSTKIIVGLIGRPREETFFTRIGADDYKAWENKLKTLEDPYLELERLELNAG